MTTFKSESQGEHMKRNMPKPEKGKKPKKYTTKNPPGGSKTPGAKAKKGKK